LWTSQTVDKVVDTLKDGGVIGTETFKLGRWKWEEEMVCEWTLRAVWWEDIRDLCEEVGGLAIQQEFSTFRDALDGRSAGVQETGESGRIFVIRRQQDSGAVTTLAYNTALFPSFYDRSAGDGRGCESSGPVHGHWESASVRRRGLVHAGG
jgi:hypothetical protein